MSVETFETDVKKYRQTMSGASSESASTFDAAWQAAAALQAATDTLCELIRPPSQLAVLSVDHVLEKVRAQLQEIEAELSCFVEAA